MHRRHFLQSALAAAALAPTAAAQTTDQAASSHPQPSPSSTQPPNLVGPSATAAYFSDDALHTALGTSTLSTPAVTTIAFNFPSWHPSPWMEARFGKGWTEFDTLQNARTLFPGHTMPHFPLWGYYDEADPIWAAREIDLAAAHNCNAWMIDWYWHLGTQFYQEQLDHGLLHAPNRDRIQFALMWANHDWKNVYPARSPDDAALLLPQVHTLDDFDHVATHCCEHYFSQPNYLRLDDAPLFAIFDVGKIIAQLGPDGPKAALTRMRERAAKLGFPRLHLQVVGGYDRYLAQLGTFGFDSATEYGNFGWTYGLKPPGSRIPYGTGCTEAIAAWHHKLASMQLPFFPCAQVGWDDSPRFGDFASIAINRSPDQFERLVRAARHTLGSRPFGNRLPIPASQNLLYIAAWNEWTEDHSLLPDTTWGTSYLEALHRATT